MFGVTLSALKRYTLPLLLFIVGTAYAQRPFSNEGTGSNATSIDGVGLVNLGTGILKMSGGSPSVALPDTDYLTPFTGVVDADSPNYASGCTVGGTTYVNPLPCAWFKAKSECVTGTSAATSSCPAVRVGAAAYHVETSLIQPACTYAGQPGITLVGVGHGASWIIGSADNHTTGLAVLQGTDSINPSSYCTYSYIGITVSPNEYFVRAIDLIAATRPLLDDIDLKANVYGETNTATGQNDVMQVGNLDTIAGQPSEPIGGVIEPIFRNIAVDSYSPGTPVQFSTTVTSGVPAVTITNPGVGYDNRADVRATGWDEIVTATGLPGPCQVMGTASWTLSGSGFATITPTGYSGCQSNMQFIASNSSAVNYGIDFLNVTDVRQMEGVSSAVGNLAQIHIGAKAGNDVFDKLHMFGAFLPVGVLVEDNGHLNTLNDTECDSIAGACVVANAQSSGSALTVNRTRSYWNTTLDYGAAELFVKNTSNYSALYWDVSSCGNTQPLSSGYHHLIMPTGPFPFNSGETGTGSLTANVVMAMHTPCDGNNVLFPLTALNQIAGGLGANQQFVFGFTGTYAGPRGYLAFDNTGTVPFVVGSSSGHNLMFKSGVAPFTQSYAGGFDSSGNFSVGNSATPASANVVLNSTAQATVNCSTSGNVLFSEPERGVNYKRVSIYENACVGTAAWTFPVAFSHAPQVVSQSLASTAGTPSATAVTITGTTSTGFVELNGW
jgi:hypothetical protein